MTAFKPEEHFRKLKGQNYLEIKWRVVWFREEHPSGWIKTELLAHDPQGGLAVFKAEAGYVDGDGRAVVATGHGDETRTDFGDFLTKAETKAIGRALALLGYGTQFAQELDEDLEKGGVSAAADSPVTAAAPRSRPAGRAPLHAVPPAAQGATVADVAPSTRDALRAAISPLLAEDPDAAGQMPKDLDDCTDAELQKTLAWLQRRKTAGKARGAAAWTAAEA
jgi:hypothetical protein